MDTGYWAWTVASTGVEFCFELPAGVSKEEHQDGRLVRVLAHAGRSQGPSDENEMLPSTEGCDEARAVL